MSQVVYLDTSAVLRAVLETGTSPEIEARLSGASHLLTSRLSLVESARALHRLRSSQVEQVPALAAAEREIEDLWTRCDVWEISARVCEHAAAISPASLLRTLDAIHLATFDLARSRLGELDLLTADRRLERALDDM